MALSLGLIVTAWVAAYGSIPRSNQTIVVVSGSELEEPLKQLESTFEQAYPHIQLALKFQGSQDMVDRYLQDQNDFKPTVLIPANGTILQEISQQWQAQETREPFYYPPQPIAKTFLVVVGWSERKEQLFGTGPFDWSPIETVLQDPKRSWQVVGGPAQWGNFDWTMTDPTRSNSSQLALALWTRAKLNGAEPTTAALTKSEIVDLFGLVKRSVYRLSPSTDGLLREFISLGPNEADLAPVYESIALYRWSQAQNQGKPYEIYYLNPTVETVSTGAIVQRQVTAGEAKAGQTFLDFLIEPAQQEVFVQYGFRPVDPDVDLATVASSPWSFNIPGATSAPQQKSSPSPIEPLSMA
jgi:ABC-type Fe3+ transport system substrate-binding protein